MNPPILAQTHAKPDAPAVSTPAEPQNAPELTQSAKETASAEQIAGQFRAGRVRMNISVNEATKAWLLATAGGERKVGRYLDERATTEDDK